MKLEPESRERLWNIANLQKAMDRKAYKRSLVSSTMFEQYKRSMMHGERNVVLPHENPKKNVL